jgi:transcription-repair coupling factor (superfamily II helicase)
VRSALQNFIAERRRGCARIMFTAGREQDLQQMERLAGLQTLRCPDWESASRPPAGKITSVLIDLDAGFRTGTTKPLLVITAADVLGSRARHSQPMARQHASEAEAVMKLAVGGAAIHLQRGLAVLSGLERVAAGGLSDREMVRLSFAKDEAALLPLAELALVWPYAADPAGVKLDDADGQAWEARRDQAERDIERTGQRLLHLKLQRQRTPAPVIVPATAQYERFVAGFSYSATPDQSAAVEDVLKDLASGIPMDRIVCGDVGFGKTEVALRAAAATVFAGKQVVLVVPTTVLARQHLVTFRTRFTPFGVEIGSLTRLTTTADARRIKSQLRDGSLKLVVGTHALAGKDVQFANLGLVIVDEEQHFGATDKAKLSALGEGIHTLTMSATPIPRTLTGAIAGLRELSVITTPPVHRAPVVTRISPFLDATLATALRREYRRRGQSFVICSRIKDIEPMLELLRRTAPELRVVAVHGRLPARELDEGMTRFVAGDADVLLATNIIENGLDIPRANTIVICSPERFGLAQLHQLRGRVGRGSTRAFAYVLTDSRAEQAQERLSVLQELSRPGAGFQISARDLDLRGAGDLLSEQQAGHVRVLGPALHNHLLQCAMQGKPQRVSDMWLPELNVDAAELLPASYVQDEPTRLDIYDRLAKADTHDEIGEVGDEIRLRFRPLPPETSNLIALASARIDCRALGIERIDAGPLGLAAHLRPGAPARSDTPLIRRDGQRLVYKHRIKDGEQVPAVIRFIEVLKSGDLKARPSKRPRNGKQTAAR